MATETSDGDPGTESEAGAPTGGVSPYIRSITVTTTATLGGIVAGVASTLFVEGSGGPIGLVILAAVIVLEIPILRLVGIDTGDFGTKDRLYIGFMSFALWYITWAIFLTTGALQ